MGYAFSKRFSPSFFDKPVVIAFFDMGLVSSSMFLVQFKAERAIILSESFNKYLGARLINQVLLKKIARDFANGQYYDKLISSKEVKHIRSKMMVLELINKARTQLTSNDEAEITIEELFGEDDYDTSFNRK